MSDDKNPTPSSLIRTGPFTWKASSDFKVLGVEACIVAVLSDVLTGEQRQKAQREAMRKALKAALASIEYPNPPAVRCAGNEDKLRVAAAQLVNTCLGSGPNSSVVLTTSAAVQALAAALTAPVPQPPAGNEELREALRILKLDNEAQDCYCEGDEGCTKHADAHAIKVLADFVALAPDGFEEELGRMKHVVAESAKEAEYWKAKAALTQPAPATGKDCGWQSIETAPKDGTPILACDDGEVLVAEFDGGAGAWRLLGSSDEVWPQAWMPLPAPPACNGTGKATACPHRCDEGKVYVSAERKSWKPCPLHGHGKREGDR